MNRWSRIVVATGVISVLVLSNVAQARTAAEYRRMADRAVAQRQYARAAAFYREEAKIYRKLGDHNAAFLEEQKADRWTTEVALYVDTPPDRRKLASLYTGAKHEPVYGCYLGAFLLKDERLGEEIETYRKPDLREENFARLIGKPLASTFMYRTYGMPFPSAWAQALARKGRIPHIAWEPRSLDEVQDDEYLYGFARQAASVGGPLFIRFAGEMNGNWTRYHGNPELYKQKFRLVTRVMRQLAPNVAMIWCVSYIPEYNIERYYPGDDAVDWVGVNAYSVLYHDNNRNRPAHFENPVSFLRFVYRKYAARKPLAICEYGASHEAALEGIDRPGFAIAKIEQLYYALPRIFPRIKLVDYFDCNNIKRAMPSRQLNNYSVTDNALILSAFKRAVSSNYYLSQAVDRTQSALPAQIKRIAPGAVLTGTARLSAWVKTYEDAPQVTYLLDGKPLVRLRSPRDYRVELDTSRYARGKHLLSLVATDSRGALAGRVNVPVVFK